MNNKMIWVLILPLMLLLPQKSQADLQLGSLFTSHMVLQRDMAVPVWGWADPGAKVTVEFADQKKSGSAEASGKWHIELDPLAASLDSKTLRVSSEGKSGNYSVACDDVLIGEVWICSGQSNMQFGYGGAPEVKALIPKVKNVRSFEVKRTVAFVEQERCEGQWVDRIPNSAVALAFAHEVQVASDVPVGIVLAAWGSTSLEAWMPAAMADSVPHFKMLLKEFEENAEAQNQIKSALTGKQPWSRSDDVFMRRQSSIIYNAMMHPLIPYACRGLVWYQGERNTQSMYGMVEAPWYSRNSGIMKYGEVLTQWMLEYRTRWGRNDFHFLVAMLPGYGAILKTSPNVPKNHPTAHSWAWMRESQLKALDLPNTGVANTVDLGDEKNIHPKDKYPVGQRLALLADRDVLGEKIEAQGPIMTKVENRGKQLIVHFDYAEGLKTADGTSPRAFWICDGVGHWVEADARIEGRTVVLESPEVGKPKYVRYAFSGKPMVNLINAAGLPAYPFRSDTFKP